MVQKYLVTGASGYIAMHVIDQLLKQGHYVRGTVRSLNDKEKVEHLKKLGPVELVEADLLDDESLRKAVKGIDIVMHVASPITPGTQEEDAFIKPAVEGTLSVLRAALEENVKRVVYTSSTATVTPFELEARTYSENDWIDADKLPKSPTSGYQKSKIYAERAAWNFVEEHKKNGGKCFELATVLPSFTIGPILSPLARSSVGLFLSLFTNKNSTEKVFNFIYASCDVRDVALAHLRAAQLDEAAGKRFIIVSSPKNVSLSVIAKIVREAGYKVADLEERQIVDSTFDDSNLRNILKIEPTEFKKSVLDTVESFVNFGIVQK